MQQRQPRLGDILDDYCPRERRVTNHAVVAMIGSEVKQTRCTTCEAEHEYKRAKIPASRKKKESPAALARELAAAGPQRPEPPSVPGAPDGRPAEDAPFPADLEAASPAGAPPPDLRPPPDGDPAPAATRESTESPGDAGAGDRPEELAGMPDEGRVHRRLIRATLPRTEVPLVRPAPTFTIRQARGGRDAGLSGKGRGGARPQGGGQGGGRPPTSKGGRHTFGRGPDPFSGRARGRDQAGGPPRHGKSGHGRPGKKPSK